MSNPKDKKEIKLVKCKNCTAAFYVGSILKEIPKNCPFCEKPFIPAKEEHKHTNFKKPPKKDVERGIGILCAKEEPIIIKANPDYVSSCCGASIGINEGNEGTGYFFCEKCQRACDRVVAKKEQEITKDNWEENYPIPNKYSHTCCWNQKGGSACGIPLEDHKQCCLCSTVPINLILSEEHIKRFWNLVNKKNNNDCWNWTGFKLKGGYGRFNINGKIAYAHRVSMFLIGKIKSVWRTNRNEICDHICKNRACVNPKHLRIVDEKTNLLENSDNFSAKNHNKTHCNNGHKFTNNNTKLYTDGGKRNPYRVCIKCRKKEIFCDLKPPKEELEETYPSFPDHIYIEKYINPKTKNTPIIEEEREIDDILLDYCIKDKCPNPEEHKLYPPIMKDRIIRLLSKSKNGAYDKGCRDAIISSENIKNEVLEELVEKLNTAFKSTHYGSECPNDGYCIECQQKDGWNNCLREVLSIITSLREEK